MTDGRVDDLRTRIAYAIAQADGDLPGMEPDTWDYELADAVIRELRLRPEYGPHEPGRCGRDSADLRTRVAAVVSAELCRQQHAIDPHRVWQWFDMGPVADAVIRELNADCIYRYACPHCGDFWFDKSERMQRFALLHGKAHTDE